MSHTVKMKVELRDQAALQNAVLALEGQVLGEGAHRLYQGTEDGFGFTLPGWTYPLVLKADGQLAYDDYGGHWGNLNDLTRLKERYAIEAARQAAHAQGWMTQDVAEGLLIYHPDGGTLTVRLDGTVDAAGFEGVSCAGATAAIEAALGTRQEVVVKDEYFAERARVTQQA